MKFFVLIFTFFSIFAFTPEVFAAKEDAHKPVNEAFRSTNLPLPRFVSLAEDKIYVRSGPGQKYPIKWIFAKRGYPVEITLEFENWRKIKDYEGQEGWVYHTLLAGLRTALIIGKEPVPAYSFPFGENEEKSRINISLDPFVIVNLEKCQAQWCLVDTSGYQGWVQRKFLWGIYEAEIFD